MDEAHFKFSLGRLGTGLEITKFIYGIYSLFQASRAVHRDPHRRGEAPLTTERPSKVTFWWVATTLESNVTVANCNHLRHMFLVIGLEIIKFIY